METKKLSKDSKTYKMVFNAINKQYGDVTQINKAFVNSNNQIFAAEWISSDLNINFNSGYAPDTVLTIIFE